MLDVFGEILAHQGVLGPLSTGDTRACADSEVADKDGGVKPYCFRPPSVLRAAVYCYFYRCIADCNARRRQSLVTDAEVEEVRIVLTIYTDARLAGKKGRRPKAKEPMH